jgi:hypothetical protein
LVQSIQEIRLRHSFVAIIALATAGCATVPEAVEGNPQACPAIESKNWHAWIEPKSLGADSYVLYISGEVVLPTPAYEVRLVAGAMDRKMPPSQRFNLQIQENGGMAAQVISTLQVRYRDKTPYPKLSSVIIVCDGQVVATLPAITIME